MKTRLNLNNIRPEIAYEWSFIKSNEMVSGKDVYVIDNKMISEFQLIDHLTAATPGMKDFYVLHDKQRYQTNEEWDYIFVTNVSRAKSNKEILRKFREYFRADKQQDFHILESEDGEKK